MPDTGQAGPGPDNRVWRFGGAEYDEARRELRVGGEPRIVEAKPLALLRELLLRAGEVASKQDLLASVWPGVTVEQSLTTAVSKLRMALGEQGRGIIESVHGIGYRIAVPIELRQAPAKSRHAFGFQPGDAVPNRPQWKLERLLGGHHTTRDVWLARHEKTGEKRVFKFADTIERLEALKREDALSRILHKALGDRPDLLRISEWNFDSRPFFIESPYGGDNLPDWAASRGGIAAIPLAERLAIVARIARTAAAAHDIGVLHRDIKPSNVLLSGDGDALAIRLVDFGSGRLTEAARIEAVTIAGLGLTAAGAQGGASPSGTLRYMAPEIIAGGPATIAADVYALGILLYQMIVGDLDRPLGAGWEADLSDPLLREDVREAASSDAARRLASALVLAERLESLDARRAEQERVSLLERRASNLAQQAERARTRRPWLILGVASLCLGLLGTSAFAILATRARDEARRQSAIARQVNSFLTDDLLGRANPRVSGRPDETLMEAVTNAEPKIAARMSQEPFVAASLYLALARAFDGRSDYGAARIDYRRAADAYETASGKNAPDAVITRLREAQMESTNPRGGSLGQAKSLIEAVEPVVDRIGSRSTEEHAWLYRARATYLFWTNDMQAALRNATDAERLMSALPGVFDQDDLNQVHLIQGLASMRLSHFDEAGTIFAHLFRSELAVHGPLYPDTLLAQRRMAQVLVMRGHPAEAIPIFEDVSSKLAKVFGEDNAETIKSRSGRVEALMAVGRYSDAVPDARLVYEAAVRQLGEHSAIAVGAQDDLADNECRAGQVQAGVKSARGAYDGAQAVYGEKSAMAQTLGLEVAECLIAATQYDAAKPFLIGLDVKAISVQISNPDTDAMIDLFKAQIAYADGDAALASRLLARPREVFRKAGADKYFARNLTALEAALGAHPETP